MPMIYFDQSETQKSHFISNNWGPHNQRPLMFLHLKRNKRGGRRCGLGAGKDRALGSHQLHLQRHLALLAACPCPCPELENVTGIEIYLCENIGGFWQGRIVGKTRLCYFSSWPCQFLASLRTNYASNTYASKFSTNTSPVTFKQISICIVLLAEQFWHIACTSSRLAFVVFLSTNFCLLIISFLTKM